MRGHADRWVVVLAGGQGRRVSHLTRDPDGTTVPKQYWDFGTGTSMLRRTLERAASVAPPERILVVVDERHRRWWQPGLRHLASSNIVVQSRDFGTALGVLGALVRVVLRQPRGVVLFLPSDHFVEREEVLAGSMIEAMRGAEDAPERVMVLGMPPGYPDPDYGWLVPGAPAGGSARRVAALVEKPTPAVARGLLSRGALWSSFIFAAGAGTLLDVYRGARPELLGGFLARARGSGWNPAAVLDLEGLPSIDFTRDVLTAVLGRLHLIQVPACGWTDLGTPARIEAWQRALPGLLYAPA